MKTKEIKIVGVKGFNADMTCRGYQYEEGKEFQCDRAEVCSEGFHLCENPIEALSYYAPSSSVYHIVEGGGDIDHDKYGSKVACTRIKIGARIDIPRLCKMTFDYVRSKCTNENNAEAGKPATAGYRGAATAGYRGAATAGEYGAAMAGEYGAATAGDQGAATAGYRGAATAGEYGAATAGEYGAATAGEYGAATAGYRGAATAGYRGAATAGDRGAATAGDKGAATSRGCVKVGENGVASVRGNNVKVCGGIGAVLLVAEEYDDSYTIKEWKAVVVDGELVKADTWYRLENGQLIECE